MAGVILDYPLLRYLEHQLFRVLFSIGEFSMYWCGCCSYHVQTNDVKLICVELADVGCLKSMLSSGKVLASLGGFRMYTHYGRVGAIPT